MVKVKFCSSILVALVCLFASAFALSSENAKHPLQHEWSFEGFFGKFDRQAVQRGFQIYKEVCSACHGLDRVAFRNLKEIGFADGEIKTIAAGYNVIDGPNDNGEMFERPGVPSDYFVAPYPNEKASRAANNGAFPPDLSLIIKARHDGANYVYSLLNGYHNTPEGMVIPEGKYYNPYMDGGVIAMAPPLSDGQATYQDGTEATVEQMSKDVVHFLQWAAEPEMEARKTIGIRTLLYLAALTIFFYVAYRRIWADVK
ncbi:cytochrome c1 [Rickettsiales endosymbiont of Stachyamoeba lipophora]|uniref:cytochrome c1 n=1 Tax=Rickettsiales endosymbiont of Stachyamoeba lipophora TaxID=2486578 RepID=UPI000F64763D|nr:cytochrome c1 [Rickettsiales endosymbiont of Stachyamoeba lipophora]AZL16446.1 cytochrome c1 [Rickettsiales endosymbiont of Stachyamoeba lipophora]